MPVKAKPESVGTPDALPELVPPELRDLADPQRDLPAIARDSGKMRLVESALQQAPSQHDLYLGDARKLDFLGRNPSILS